MALLSPVYVALIAVAALLFQVCPDRYRNAYLTAVSLSFYSLFSTISAGVMVCFTLLTFVAARKIDEYREHVVARFVLWAAIAVQLAYLVFLKAIPVLGRTRQAGAAARFLAGFGVSYYTFKLIGYLIDVYWARQAPIHDVTRLLAFASFFPQLSAGPIQRAGEFALPETGAEMPRLMATGLRRILLGFVKKIVVADPLGAIVAMIAGNPHDYHNQIWVLCYLYPVQLYADFSALTDIAVGAAALFGVKSPENFALPFFAPSISQYWRRWHMTLTRWLTDYVFTPLRMATRDFGEWGLALSITINMALIGLWHGLNAGFLCFGLVHAGYLIVEARTGRYRRRLYLRYPMLDRLTNIAGPLVVYHLVALALIFFRDGTIAGSMYTIRRFPDGLMHPWTSLNALHHTFGGLRSLYAFAGLIAFCAIDVAALLRSAEWKPWRRVPRFATFPRPLRWAVYYAAIILEVVLYQQSSQFIYVQF